MYAVQLAKLRLPPSGPLAAAEADPTSEPDGAVVGLVDWAADGLATPPEARQAAMNAPMPARPARSPGGRRCARAPRSDGPPRREPTALPAWRARHSARRRSAARHR